MQAIDRFTPSHSQFDVIRQLPGVYSHRKKNVMLMASSASVAAPVVRAMQEQSQLTRNGNQWQWQIAEGMAIATAACLVPQCAAYPSIGTGPGDPEPPEPPAQSE